MHKGELSPDTKIPHVTLIDFGLAVRTDRVCTRYNGTMPFVAPEVLRNLPHNAAAADIWALGVLLLEILFGVNTLPRVFGWTGAQGPAPEDAVEDLKSLFADVDIFLTL